MLAKQGVSTHALVALVTSLFVSVLVRGLDRRWVLMGLSVC